MLVPTARPRMSTAVLPQQSPWYYPHSYTAAVTGCLSAGSGLTSSIEIHMPLFLVLSVELGVEPRSLLGRLSTSEPNPQPIVDTFKRFCAPRCYLEISAVIRTIASLVYYINEETLPMTITICFWLMVIFHNVYNVFRSYTSFTPPL